MPRSADAMRAFVPLLLALAAARPAPAQQVAGSPVPAPVQQATAAPVPVPAQQAAGPNAPEATLPVPDGLRSILGHPSLRGARLGVVATSALDGSRLIALGEHELFAPASVAKLFTTAAALHRLGPHYVWETPLAYAGSRAGEILDGDLWVLGRGAPDLVEEKIWVAAVSLHKEGLARVTGDIVVDDRYFDDARYGDGWPGGRQVREAYHAPIGALMANFAAVRVEASWEAVPDPALHFGERLRALLGMAGVAVDGAVRRPSPQELGSVPAPDLHGTVTGASTVPPPLTPLHTIRSEPLGRIVMDVNKFSNNVMAEVLLKALGAMEYGAPGTATKGLAVVARFLDREVGIPLNSYVQADGSGLSRNDRFTPGHVSRLLLHAYRDFHIGPELTASLKLGGLDGWNPAAFKQPPLQGELRVKSGHISGVNTLGGFLHSRSGAVIVFCAMINDHHAGQWEIDQRMAEIVDWLIRSY